MTKIVAIVMAYQCADVILSCLQSVDGLVDEIMCFDGIWIGYEGPEHSNDGTDKIIIEFAKTSKSKVSYHQLPKMHQYEARTMALKHLKNEEWGVILDADEEIVEWGDDVRKILELSHERAYRVCEHLYKNYAATPTPRCFRITECLRVSTDHRRLFDDQGELDIRFAPIIHIVYEHQKLSDQKRMRKQADSYKEWLLKWENAYWNAEDK